MDGGCFLSRLNRCVRANHDDWLPRHVASSLPLPALSHQQQIKDLPLGGSLSPPARSTSFAPVPALSLRPALVSAPAVLILAVLGVVGALCWAFVCYGWGNGLWWAVVGGWAAVVGSDMLLSVNCIGRQKKNHE